MRFWGPKLPRNCWTYAAAGPVGAGVTEFGVLIEHVSLTLLTPVAPDYLVEVEVTAVVNE